MENIKKLTITDWALDDRPREKMMNKGAAVLSDAELLAILIGSGNREETAVEVGKRILAFADNNLHVLGKKTIQDLCQFKGIGEAKAISIAAAMELGKRRKASDIQQRTKIESSIDIYNIFHPIMCDLHTEEFWILLLNQAFSVIEKVKISTGGITATVADTRTILREALLHRATSLVLCHNHPSGNKNPSRSDDQITTQIQQASKVMDILLADHLVVCDGTYYSYADEGRLY